MKNTLLSFALCIVVAGCATPMSVTSDYDTSVDFATMKAYDWMPATGNAAGNELAIKQIKSAVDSQLQAKGRKLSTSKPDFLIGMSLSGKTTYGGSTSVGMSIGIPVGRSGTVSVGGGRTKPREKHVGTLVLNFVDAKTRSLIWQATATDAVNPSASPEERQRKIDEVVMKMMGQFPPK